MCIEKLTLLPAPKSKIIFSNILSKFWSGLRIYPNKRNSIPCKIYKNDYLGTWYMMNNSARNQCCRIRHRECYSRAGTAGSFQTWQSESLRVRRGQSVLSESSVALHLSGHCSRDVTRRWVPWQTPRQGESCAGGCSRRHRCRGRGCVLLTDLELVTD